MFNLLLSEEILNVKDKDKKIPFQENNLQTVETKDEDGKHNNISSVVKKNEKNLRNEVGKD